MYNVFFLGKAADVRHNGLMEDLLKLRDLFGDNGFYTGILKTDGIEHTLGTFRDTRRGITEARILGRTLEGERTEAVDVIKLSKFIAEAERTAGGNDRVIDLDTAKIYFCVYHITSSFLSTGPSRQIRLLPYFVLQVQPMQAPKPQPMRSSKLSSPLVLEASESALSIGIGPQA